MSTKSQFYEKLIVGLRMNEELYKTYCSVFENS